MNINPQYDIASLQTLVPAAFTAAPAGHLSGSYAHVTTSRVIDALLQDGWRVTGAEQRRTRVRQSIHAGHRISLTHPELPTHSEGTPQMHLSNASDGSAALRVLGGFLRKACLNQMYAGVKVVGGVFNHRGGSLEDRVVAGARDLRANFDKVIRKFDLWSMIEVSPEQELAFANAALALRWPTNTPAVTDFTPFLAPRRAEDQKASLWMALNRSQEAVIRGGFKASFITRDEAGQVTNVRTSTVRKITGLASNERVNVGLFDLADATAAKLGA